MKMGFNLTIEQSQKLIMTPQLRQAINILQLPALELSSYIDEIITANPLLEREIEQESNKLNIDGVDWKKYIDNRVKEENPKLDYEKNDEEKEFDFSPPSKPTLIEYLKNQLLHVSEPRSLISVALYLVECLDYRGYLLTPLEILAEARNIKLSCLEDALKIVQGLEPFGIGARTLEECLLIQLESKGLLDETFEELISNHLDDIAFNRLTKISKSLNIDVNSLLEYINVIKGLEPKPGCAFYSGEEIKYVIPDITIRFLDSKFIVLQNDNSSPRITISRVYKDLINSEGTSPELATYLNDKLDAALWILKSIEQRRMTLQKVAEAIVEIQEDFLRVGPTGLKPLSLKDIASMVGVHESTVSRAIKDKYAQTPHGLVPLKYFFGGSLSSSEGDEISTEIIKLKIKAKIEQEDARKPLSDQKIADLLRLEGIEVSRRTIAKYREEMGIGSTSKRRDYS